MTVLIGSLVVVFALLDNLGLVIWSFASIERIARRKLHSVRDIVRDRQHEP